MAIIVVAVVVAVAEAAAVVVVVVVVVVAVVVVVVVVSHTPYSTTFFTASFSGKSKHRITGNFSSQPFMDAEGGAVSVFACKESVFSKYLVFR
jgi:preprotein translocase subunit SecG